jgi:hypothetical protein
MSVEESTERGYHVSRDEGGNVQVWPSIEIKFVMDELIGGIRRNAFLGNGEFGDCLGTAVAARVGRRSIAMDMADPGVAKVTAEVDDFFRVNVLAALVAMPSTGRRYLVKNHD